MNSHCQIFSKLLVYSLLLACCVARDYHYCGELEDLFRPGGDSWTFTATRRRVDQEQGNDAVECLNVGQSPSPPSCRTLQYALHESPDNSLATVRPNLRLDLNPGTYRAINETAKILNTRNVTIVGAGVSETIMVCGRSGDEDAACNYPNFQIANSSHIYVRGITFTGCGPITSSMYIATSDFVFIDECSFEDDVSPALLVYNSPNIMITNTTFLNNIPTELPLKVVHDVCYFTRGVDTSFFLDNRTTSGGISLYMEGETANILIDNCTFINNTARNDSDVVLVRRSERNGHGGALNIRLINSSESTVCIRRTLFSGNSAEAHAGALAISVAGIAQRNHFIVSDTVFERNRCVIAMCTGGAVGITLLTMSQFNTLLFQDSDFTGNEAESGGAIVLSTSVGAVRDETGLSDILRLENCRFMGNQAFFEGTALGVFSITHTNQIGISVEVTDCLFHDNQASRSSGDTTAVTVYRVLLTFYGDNSFLSNLGGGVSLLSSRMDVKGQVMFRANTAVFGAGVAMSGRSLILLHEDSEMHFESNLAKELGAGIYVEYSSSDFVLSILNTGCFIRYNSTSVDLPPTQWRSHVTFVNNTAEVAGAAIFASDLSRCRWLGELLGDHTIFEIPPERGSPFLFVNNRVVGTESGLRGRVVNQTLGTSPSDLTANLDLSYTGVSYGEQISFSLYSEDQLGNFREAVWSVSTPGVIEQLGALSSNNSVFTYYVPAKDDLASSDNTTHFTVAFSLLNRQSTGASMELTVRGCHPGYHLDEETCVCSGNSSVVRCDKSGRYFYARDGFWVGVRDDSTPFFANTIPGFLNCSRLGTLPGCIFKFDRPDEQCAAGREGTLCGDCKPGYGVTFDLRSCQRNCGPYGVLLFILICLITPPLSLAVLYFDFPIPNELKGVIFYAQVIGVIYRSTPYLLTSTTGSFRGFFDFLVNVFGFAMPFPVCLHEDLPVVVVALLGYVPPLLATVTAIAYAVCANRVKQLSHRENYGFHGFYLLLLFVYKYFVDTSFIFVSCTNVDGESVFLYQGTQKCRDFPLILLVVFGSLMLVLFGIILPIYVLKIIYAPKKMIHVRSTLAHGLKDGRKYLWYSVWDIWRRLLFVAANLFISITTRSVVLFIHSLLVFLCLSVLCIVKPYRKYHINIMEGLIILSLFSTTLAIYDRDNDLYVGVRTAAVSIVFPFLYGSGYIVYRFLKMVHRKMWPMVKRKWYAEERQEQMWMWRGVVWCQKMKGKAGELLGLLELEDSDIRETDDDIWRLEVIQPMRERNPDSLKEESYAPHLREALLEDDTHT